MAIGINDAIQKRGTQVELQDNTSALLAAAAFVKCATLNYGPTQSSGAPDVEIALTFDPSVAIASGQVIYIHVRPINVDGIKDTPVPSASYVQHQKGVLYCEAVATEQTLRAVLKNMPENSEIYFENAAGQQWDAGWVAKATPLTRGPSA